jgi:hypothetical protein
MKAGKAEDSRMVGRVVLARGLVVGLLVAGIALPALAGPTRYNPRRAGHPLRVAAYIAHPFGVILDTLIFHPAWWIGQHEPFHTLFGVQSVLEDDVELRTASAVTAPVVAPEPEPGPAPEADIEDGAPGGPLPD